MRKKNSTQGLTPKQERARRLLAVLDEDPSKTGRTADKLKAARAAVTKLAHLAGTPRTENNAETFAAACSAVNASSDQKMKGLAKRQVNNVLRALGKLPQTIEPWDEGRGEALREMFEDPEGVSSDEGTEVSDALHALAQLLRVELPDATDELPEFYLRVIRELRGDVRAEAALSTVSNVPGHWRRKRGEAGREESTTAAPETGPRFRVLNIPDDRLRLLGLVRGEKCKVYDVDDLKLGEAVVLELKGGKGAAAVGRVFSLDAERVTVRNDYGDQSFSRAEISRVGRIDYLNPWKADPLTKDERGRVNYLQSKLEKLDEEDDQIIRCTRRYELEKEIFDIEHPPAGLGDWSEWEEADDAE